MAFGIGIYYWQNGVNIGTLWRSALCFGASFLFVIGKPYELQSSDNLKAGRHLPLVCYPDWESFQVSRPMGWPLVAVEQAPEATLLQDFHHPRSAIYLLGSEGTGLPGRVLAQSQSVVQMGSRFCLNVATAGSIVMWHRSVQGRKID